MTKPRRLSIILDPGHGNKNGQLPADPGVTGRGAIEAVQNLLLCLTLKYHLIQAGYDVRLTRTGQERPSFPARTRGMGTADLYIAVHMDSEDGRAMVLYPDRERGCVPSTALSHRFALTLAHYAQPTPGKEFIVAIDSDKNWCRFQRLYIRDTLAPVSVLWEVDSIHSTETGERIDHAQRLVRAIQAAQKAGVLPV